MGSKIINSRLLLIILLAIAAVLALSSTAFAQVMVHVTDIYNPTSLNAFQYTVVTAQLQNYYQAGYFDFAMYIDNVWAGTWSYYMGEWAWGTVSIAINGGLAPGYHTITFCTSENCLTEGWIWTGTPDLRLTDIYPPTSLVAGQDTVIEARIDNIGNADAGPFSVYMYVDGQYTAFWNYTGGLPVGWSSEPYVTLPGGLDPGTHSIYFFVDATNAVAESNEGNNTLTENFVWVGPDLRLTEIYQPTSLVGGEATIIKARIDNIGNANAGHFYAALYIDDQYITSWNFAEGLPAGWYSEPYVMLPGDFVAGIHTIQFIVDAENAVFESDKSNNTLSRFFIWTGIPDLELTHIYQPTSLVGGQDSTINVRITNLGYADAGPFYVCLYIDGQYADCIDFYSGLAARSYNESSITIPGGLVAGSHIIYFIADPENVVAESREDNNADTENFIWTGTPDLELTDIYQPTSLVEGEDSTITAKITNIGYADTGDFYIAMYVDNNIIYRNIVSGLPAKNEMEFSVIILAGLLAGTYDIKFEADYYNNVIESREDNNNLTKNWTWARPFSGGCSPQVGSGTGVLGNAVNHIDTCYDSNNAIFLLYDVSRRAGQTGHNHSGGMLPDHGIKTYYSNTITTMDDSDNLWNANNQTSGVDAHVNAASVYDYLRLKLGLNSFDGIGSSMDSRVEVTQFPDGTQCIDNAFWNSGSKSVSYCIRSGQPPKPSDSGALDVVAHEWGHAITRTIGANFINTAQPKALNEAFSDWMGTAVEHFYGKPNWTIGEEINDISRDLSNPPAYQSYCYWPLQAAQPDHMNGYTICGSPVEEAYVNMGIPNKMFYLLSAGGTHKVSNITVQGIGIEKAIKIAYEANIGHWQNNATFSNARDGMVTAAWNFYGDNEVYQVKNAWAAVGVGRVPIVTTSVWPSAGGTVSGSGSYAFGSTATLVAAHNVGYKFQNWTDENIEVSTSETYSFVVEDEEDITLVANFVPAPAIAVTPSSYDFGSSNVGDTSPPYTFTVANIGNAPMIVNSALINGVNAAEFSRTVDGCTGGTILPNASCIIQVTFSPTTMGAKSAALTIISDDPYNPILNIALSGTGIAPIISMSPAAHNFGAMYIGNSLFQTFTVANTGTAPMIVNSALINGVNIFEFSKVIDNCTGITVNPNGSCTIQVSFNPASVGTKNVLLSISSNDPFSPIKEVPLSGIGIVRLAVNKTGTGTGTVTSSPQGISCGADCIEDYINPTTVTLTAVPDACSDFIGWNGGGCSGTGTCTILMNTNFLVEAMFTYEALVGAFSVSTDNGSAPFAVTVSDQSSYCSLYPPIWNWDFGDGTTSTMQNPPAHIYRNAGNYTVSLTVTNAIGATSTATKTINVQSCSNPTIKIGSSSYSSLQAAYDAAVDGDVIKAQALSFAENLNINRDITITLEGGYNCDCTNTIENTYLIGMVTISAGNITMKNFVLSSETVGPTTTASPTGGIYSATSVTLTCSAGSSGSGCDKIYYTTDGTTPTTSSTVYAGPINIPVTTTLKYFAKDLAGNSESVKTQTYTIDTQVPTGTISINNGSTSTNNIDVTLSITCADSSGCDQMQLSNDNITWSAAETFAVTKAWTLTTGDGQKTVYVKFKDTPGNWSNIYTASILVETTAPTTTASPSEGTYNGAQTVVLICDDDSSGSGCDKIYYTTDGTTPTTSSTVYTGPINIPVTTTLKYFAKDLAGNSEEVKTQIYTITANGSNVININGQDFTSLQAAYDAAQEGNTIKVQAVAIVENLNINRNVAVTLDGGYNSDYTAKVGDTTLKGMIQTLPNGGTITIGNFIISN